MPSDQQLDQRRPLLAQPEGEPRGGVAFSSLTPKRLSCRKDETVLDHLNSIGNKTYPTCHRSHTLFFESTAVKKDTCAGHDTSAWTWKHFVDSGLLTPAEACKEGGKEIVASCRQCEIYLCQSCFEMVANDQHCPRAPPPNFHCYFSECEGLQCDFTSFNHKRTSLTQQTQVLIKSFEGTREGPVADLSTSFAKQEGPDKQDDAGPVWEAFRWLPDSYVPEDLREPLRQWINKYQSQLAEKPPRCHLALGHKVAGPAVRPARRANVLIWGFYVANLPLVWMDSECSGEAGRGTEGMVARYTGSTSLVAFVIILAVAMKLEDQCLRYVLPAPHLLAIRRIKIMGVWHAPFPVWRVFTLAMSVVSHLDLYTTGVVVATSIKQSVLCFGPAEKMWSVVVRHSPFLSLFPSVKLWHFLLGSWFIILAQVFFAFAYAQPLKCDSEINWGIWQKRSGFTYPVLFAGHTKVRSHYDALQYFAEAGRMYSINCNDFSYDTCIVMREIERVFNFMTLTGDRELREEENRMVGEYLAWGIYRRVVTLNKKVTFFFLVFIGEKMFQLHLKVTYLGMQKHLADTTQHRSFQSSMLVFSTAITIMMSVMDVFAFVKMAFATYEIKKTFSMIISLYHINTDQEFFVPYFKRYVHLGNLMWRLRLQVVFVFVCAVLGVLCLTWAAVKLVMVEVCHDCMWNLAPPWDLKSGCVDLNSTTWQSNSTL